MFPSSNLSTDCSRSSSCTSSSTSSSSFSFLPNTKTMEEVWKDITSSSLTNTPPHHRNHHNNHHHHHHPTSTSNFRGMIFQDFLNAGDPPIDYGCPPPPPPPPATVLSLNSGPEFRFHDNNGRCGQLQGSPVPNFTNLGTGETAFDALNQSSVLASFGGKKRFSESDENGSGSCSVDRRSKRMIKNRESAARSRARKQAYVTELEDKVRQLQEENERLVKQQQQLFAASRAQLPKKHSLHRTSTASF